jgi:hypothetical protein
MPLAVFFLPLAVSFLSGCTSVPNITKNRYCHVLENLGYLHPSYKIYRIQKIILNFISEDISKK